MRQSQVIRERIETAGEIIHPDSSRTDDSGFHRKHRYRTPRKLTPDKTRGARAWGASPEDDAEFRGMWLAGASVKDIGQRFGASKFVVNSWRVRLKLEPRRLQAHRHSAETGMTPARAARFKEMMLAGATLPQVRAELGINNSAIYRWRLCLGLPSRHVKPDGSSKSEGYKATAESDREFTQMWLQGTSVKVVCSYFGVTKSTVTQWRLRLGLKPRSRKPGADEPRRLQVTVWLLPSELEAARRRASERGSMVGPYLRALLLRDL